jgi:hypothetical protein
MLDSCKNPRRFASTKEWQMRTRACIETTALLVCRANARLFLFGDIAKLLGSIGSVEETGELSSLETDRQFVMRWTCLSLVTIRSILERNTTVQEKTEIAVKSFAGEHDTSDGQAPTCAQNIAGTFRDARSSLLQLNDALIRVENTKEQVMANLQDYEPQVSRLANIDNDADQLDRVDQPIFDVRSSIVTESQGIILQLPGAQFDYFNLFAKWYHNSYRQLILPGRTLKGIYSLGTTFRTILAGSWDAGTYQETLKIMREFLAWKGDLLQRQLWRLQDLHDGGGLGFTVELFFLSLEQLLSMPPLNESDSQLCANTLRTITSYQTKHRRSLGTQKLLLDMILPHGIISEFRYPTNITNVFFDFLGAFLEGQGGSHLDDAMQELLAPDIYTPYDDERDAFRDNTLRVITRARAPTP